jgi:hypothetical protein
VFADASGRLRRILGLRFPDSRSPGLHLLVLVQGILAHSPDDLLDCLPRLRFPEAHGKRESEAKFRVKNGLKQMKTLQSQHMTPLANVNAC